MEEKARLQFLNVTVEELGAPPGQFPGLKEVKVRVCLLKVPDGISADFEADFTVLLSCSRCLQDIEVSLSEKYHLDYVAGRDPHRKSEKVDLDASEIERIYYQGSEIDLSIGIREMIILALPIAPLCKTDCAGLCPVCGRNLNEGDCSCPPVKTEVFKPKPRTALRRKIRAPKKK